MYKNTYLLFVIYISHHIKATSVPFSSSLSLSTPELIQKSGYPAESHSVTTSDGYILTMHRIPYSPKSPAAANKSVVFLQHGLFSSSADWILLGPEKALGYLLADEGYDVWMGNARGNTYSTKHNFLNLESYKFWDFSWHEMGIFDLPSEIDYVLGSTNQNEMYYVGHSMGTTMFYVLNSMKPEYNAKFKHMVSLAPIAYMAHTNNPLIKLASCSPFTEPGLFTLAMLGMGEFAPHINIVDDLSEKLCSNSSLVKDICHNLVFSILGSKLQNINSTMLPLIESNVPAGSSFKTVLHYLQEISSVSGKFRQWDYYLLNWSMYRQLEPPEYNVSAITTPISLFYGDMDTLGDFADVSALSRTLPNSAGVYHVPLNTFTHLDFIWANDIKELVYNKLISIFKNN